MIGTNDTDRRTDEQFLEFETPIETADAESPLRYELRISGDRPLDHRLDDPDVLEELLANPTNYRRGFSVNDTIDDLEVDLVEWDPEAVEATVHIAADVVKDRPPLPPALEYAARDIARRYGKATAGDDRNPTISRELRDIWEGRDLEAIGLNRRRTHGTPNAEAIAGAVYWGCKDAGKPLLPELEAFVDANTGQGEPPRPDEVKGRTDTRAHQHYLKAAKWHVRNEYADAPQLTVDVSVRSLEGEHP